MIAQCTLIFEKINVFNSISRGGGVHDQMTPGHIKKFVPKYT